MNGGIFLIQNDGELVEMKEQPYDSESLLQELVAKYPNLLAGDQIDKLEPRRWLLISREMGIPDDEDAADRWSLDHLFLDQDGIPTLVEVKRSTDTRLRREVVAQMLDYAANAVVYWSVDQIRAQLDDRCERENIESARLIEELGVNANQEQFWEQVKTNLRAGKIRLVFVADVIPDELLRIIEFLNEQMNSTQVLAIEIKQYVGQGLKTLVPRVYGQTVEAEQAKSISRRIVKKWDEGMFRQVFITRGDLEGIRVVDEILAWTKKQNLRIWWGEGLKEGSFYPIVDHKGRSTFTVSVRTGFKIAYVQVPFPEMRRNPPFDSDSKCEELAQRLKKIPGIQIPDDYYNRYPRIDLTLLYSSSAFNLFVETMDWIVQESKNI